jgi:hypothetical protein
MPVITDRHRTSYAYQSCLFVGFDLGRTLWPAFRNRPSLWNGPPPLTSRGDQKNIYPVVSDSKWKRGKLLGDHDYL